MNTADRCKINSRFAAAAPAARMLSRIFDIKGRCIRQKVRFS